MMCSSKVVSTLASWSFLHKEKECTGKRRKQRGKGKSRVGKKPSKILWLKEVPTQCLPKARQINSTMKIWKVAVSSSLHILSQKGSLKGGLSINNYLSGWKLISVTTIMYSAINLKKSKSKYKVHFLLHPSVTRFPNQCKLDDGSWEHFFYNPST